MASQSARRQSSAALIIAAATICLSAQSREVADFRTLARECPQLDSTLCGIVDRENQRAEADVALDTVAPGGPLIRRLLSSGRIADAVTLLERAIAIGTTPAIDAMNAFGEMRLPELDTRGEASRELALAAISRAETMAAKLPREDAARLKWSATYARLMVAPRNVDANAMRGAQLAFVKEFAGTEAAQLVEVDLLVPPYGSAAATRLEAYAAAHSKSVAGAKALYQAGFQLGHNLGIGYNLPAGTDPTPYALRVMTIINTLEHGDFPPCKWVTDAAGLANVFEAMPRSDKRPAFAPGSVERLLAVYQDFVASHLDADERSDALGSATGYVVTAFIVPWYELIGVTDGVERTLAYAEARGVKPETIALFRAEYLATRTGSGAKLNDAALADASAALDALASTGSGYTARKALATKMAMLEWVGRDRDFANEAERYLAAYPDSPWAWGAAVRLGQTRERLGETSAAADAYDRAASLTTSTAVHIIVMVLQAQLHESRNNFALSLDLYRNTERLWTGAVPDTIDVTPPGGSTGSAPGARPQRTYLVRQDVRAHVAALERYASFTNGDVLQRAQRQFDVGNFVAARELAGQYLQRQPDTRAIPAARDLRHAAEFELAMAAGANDSKSPDFTGAIAALSSEPIDGPVAAARFAKALMLARDTDRDRARALLLDTLAKWRDSIRLPTSTDDGLDRDIAAVMSTSLAYVSLQHEQSSYGKPILPLPADTLAVTRNTIRLTLPGAQMTSHPLTILPDSFERAIVVSELDLSRIARVCAIVVGREPPKPVAELWTALFPSAAGSWNGWFIETYPSIGSVKFDDEARTRASVGIGLDSMSGYTAVMEKTDGRWTVVRIINRWIS